MADRPKRPRDPNQLAKLIVDLATGEASEAAPKAEGQRRGGLKGGVARAKVTGERGHERKYSPAECVGAIKEPIFGKPDMAEVSTSHVERQNLTMRMGMRRFTRLTNAFSKKIENHAYAVALHFMHYNYVRTHKTLRMPPAMAAGLTTRPWEVEDIVALVEAAEEPPKKRSPYKPRHPRISN